VTDKAPEERSKTRNSGNDAKASKRKPKHESEPGPAMSSKADRPGKSGGRAEEGALVEERLAVSCPNHKRRPNTK